MLIPKSNCEAPPYSNYIFFFYTFFFICNPKSKSRVELRSYQAANQNRLSRASLRSRDFIVGISSHAANKSFVGLKVAAFCSVDSSTNFSYTPFCDCSSSSVSLDTFGIESSYSLYASSSSQFTSYLLFSRNPAWIKSGWKLCSALLLRLRTRPPNFPFSVASFRELSMEPIEPFPFKELVPSLHIVFFSVRGRFCLIGIGRLESVMKASDGIGD